MLNFENLLVIRSGKETLRNIEEILELRKNIIWGKEKYIYNNKKDINEAVVDI